MLCDDHRLFVEPMVATLRARGHEAIMAITPAEAIRLADLNPPDLCLMDLHFPDGEDDGLWAVGVLRQRHPACAVVVLSACADPAAVEAATRAGAVGFLRKDQSVATIFDVVERISSGRPVSLPSPRRPAAYSPMDERARRLLADLTAREQEVLRRLVQAQDTTRIARSLGIEPSTARTHLQNVLLKLGVHSRLQAVALVVAAGLEGEI